METATGIREADLRAVVALLADVVALDADYLEKKRYLIDGLSQLIGATGWVWCFKRNNSMIHHLSSAISNPDTPRPEEEGGSFVVNSRQIEEDALSTISFYRGRGKKPFSGWEIRIAEMILDEIPWMHLEERAGHRTSAFPKLSPRQSDVFKHLVKGYTRSEISEVLSLSEHTISEYTKTIFLKFKVHSQAQLMRVAMNGNSTNRSHD